MKLINFNAEGVHGYLKYNFDFKEELTFITGINGAGKTTAIKLILGLLSPSWFNLTQIKYNFAEVKCTAEIDGKDTELIIRATQIEESEKVDLFISMNGQEDSSKIKSFELPLFSIHEATKYETRHILTRITRLESHFEELSVVKQIRSLVTPIYLGLDRRIHEGKQIDSYSIETFSRERDFSQNVKGNLFDSLVEAENLIKNHFLNYSQTQQIISLRLKNDIISSSFDVIDSKSLEIDPESVNLDKRKEQIQVAFQKIRIPGIEERVTDYFIKMNKLQDQVKKIKKGQEQKQIHLISQLFINVPQLERIDKIIALYKKANIELDDAYSPFSQLIELTNQFFSESGKKLNIESNGVINIILPDGAKSPIYRLSSGEKQILIMLTQLIFGEQHFVFIIDEPELSLHLGWQQIFVDSLRKASPITQFVLATHSPSIVGKIENEKYCVDLSYNVD